MPENSYPHEVHLWLKHGEAFYGGLPVIYDKESSEDMHVIARKVLLGEAFKGKSHICGECFDGHRTLIYAKDHYYIDRCECTSNGEVVCQKCHGTGEDDNQEFCSCMCGENAREDSLQRLRDEGLI